MGSRKYPAPVRVTQAPAAGRELIGLGESPSSRLEASQYRTKTRGRRSVPLTLDHDDDGRERRDGQP